MPIPDYFFFLIDHSWTLFRISSVTFPISSLSLSLSLFPTQNIWGTSLVISLSFLNCPSTVKAYQNVFPKEIGSPNEYFSTCYKNNLVPSLLFME